MHFRCNNYREILVLNASFLKIKIFKFTLLFKKEKMRLKPPNFELNKLKLYMESIVTVKDASLLPQDHHA